MQYWMIVGLAALALAGCGGQTLGGAATAWCHKHYPETEKTESVCFNAIMEQDDPAEFLGLLEGYDQTKAEIESLPQMP